MSKYNTHQLKKRIVQPALTLDHIYYSIVQSVQCKNSDIITQAAMSDCTRLRRSCTQATITLSVMIRPTMSCRRTRRYDEDRNVLTSFCRCSCNRCSQASNHNLHYIIIIIIFFNTMISSTTCRTA